MTKPALTVDAVIIRNDEIVLIKRANKPFKDFWALPGGYVEYGETVEEAIIREVKEETGLEVKIKELLGVYSDPRRDPRGHTVSICFLTTYMGGDIKADTDASESSFFKIFKALKLQLAFDHNQILKDALNRL